MNFLFIYFGFFETGFLCVALAVLELTLWSGLKLTEIYLPLPPKCWIKGMHHHCLPVYELFRMCRIFLRHSHVEGEICRRLNILHSYNVSYVS